jgi:RpiR family carbohydrate utilization transcriptional regulator
MRVPVSVIERIQDQRDGLARAERRVAEIILADIEASLRLSIKELAAQAQTSEPTVLRFARRMGCEGFADFKLRLSQDFAISRMFVVDEHEGSMSSGEVVTNLTYEAAAQALAYGFQQRDPEALERAALAVCNARRVFCMGVGGSSANIAIEAENRFFRYDVAASAIIDPYRQRIAAGLCQSDDVVLLFSITGQPRSLIDSAETAGALGATTIAVTRPQSALARAAGIVLPVDVPDHEKHLQIPHRSRYAQLYVLDCLATLMATRRLDQSAPKLRRLRAMLIALHGPTDQQPIGD